jgi:hypothetical protein
MSYDVAIWDGDRPTGDEEASALFDTLIDAFEDDPKPPSATISAFMDDVLGLWPDEDSERDDFPWAVAPVMPESASGDTAYLNLTLHEEVDAMVADIVRVARQHGLHVYDPQREELIS